MKRLILVLATLLLALPAGANDAPSPRDSAPPDQNCISPGKALYVAEAKFLRFGANVGEEEATPPTLLNPECPFTRSAMTFRGNAKPDSSWVRYLFHETEKGKGTLHVEYDITIEKPGAAEGRRYGSFDAPVDITKGSEQQLIDHKADDKTLSWLRILVRYRGRGENSF